MSTKVSPESVPQSTVLPQSQQGVSSVVKGQRQQLHRHLGRASMSAASFDTVSFRGGRLHPSPEGWGVATWNVEGLTDDKIRYIATDNDGYGHTYTIHAGNPTKLVGLFCSRFKCLGYSLRRQRSSRMVWNRNSCSSYDSAKHYRICPIVL